MTNITVNDRSQYGKAAEAGEIRTTEGKKVILPEIHRWDGSTMVSVERPLAVIRRKVEAWQPEDVLKPLDQFVVAWAEQDKAVQTDAGSVIAAMRHLAGNGHSVMTEHAVKQACAIAGAPFAYLRSLPSTLATACLQQSQKQLIEAGKIKGLYTQRQIRDTQTGQVVTRALVSDKYADLDSLPLVEALCDVLDGTPAHVAGFRHDATGLDLRVIIPGSQQVVDRGDVVYTGIHVRDNEVGAGSVSIAGLVYELACANGMVAPGKVQAGYTLRHVGNKDRLRQYVREALESAKGDAAKLVNAFNEALQVKLEAPALSIEALSAEGMTRAQLDAIMAAYLEDTHASLFGVTRAVTRAAQAFEPDTRFEMEQLGSRLVLSAPKHIITPPERQEGEAAGIYLRRRSVGRN